MSLPTEKFLDTLPAEQEQFFVCNIAEAKLEDLLRGVALLEQITPNDFHIAVVKRIMMHKNRALVDMVIGNGEELRLHLETFTKEEIWELARMYPHLQNPEEEQASAFANRFVQKNYQIMRIKLLESLLIREMYEKHQLGQKVRDLADVKHEKGIHWFATRFMTFSVLQKMGKLFADALRYAGEITENGTWIALSRLEPPKRGLCHFYSKYGWCVFELLPEGCFCVHDANVQKRTPTDEERDRHLAKYLKDKNESNKRIRT